jgi:glycerophosphoryl diester phosphodiesterase
MTSKVLAAMLCLASAACVAQIAARASFDLQGHRGARGLAPENTLAAFRRAMEVGVTTLETDVAITRDHVPVISHNADLNPDLVREGGENWLARPGPPIHSLLLAELERYDVGRVNPSSRYAQDFPEQRAADGERFPTLAELLQLVKRSETPVRLNIETKLTPDDAGAADPTTFVRLIVDVLKEAEMLDRATIQSFDWRTLIEAKRAVPSIATSCLTIESPNMNTVAPEADGKSRWHAGFSLTEQRGSVPALVKAAGCGTWSMFWQNLTPALVTEAHAMGIKVLPWTVNDPADMRRLIEMQVDGIITDYPDRLRRVMAEKGLQLP